MPDIVIGTFADLFLIFCKGFKKKDTKEKIISHGFKYQWNQSNRYDGNLYKEHLLCFVVIYSNQRSLHTVRKKLNRDNKPQAIFDGRSMIEFM